MLTLEKSMYRAALLNVAVLDYLFSQAIVFVTRNNGQASDENCKQIVVYATKIKLEGARKSAYRRQVK